MDRIRESFQLANQPVRILLALSGGADSCALFHALKNLQEELGFSLFCAHINHGLRLASQQEEEWVRELADSYQIPLKIIRVNVSRKGNLENNARLARYQALESARLAAGCQIIALGHHAHDQAETLLMNLMRGSGLEGMAGMHEFRHPLWRPLLRLGKPDLLAYLKDIGQDWLEDQSNQDVDFLRNRLRIQFFPMLEQLSQGVAKRFSRTAALLADDLSMVQDMAEHWLQKHSKIEQPIAFLMRKVLLCQPLSLQRHVLRIFCTRLGIIIDFRQTEALRTLLQSAAGSKTNLPSDFHALITEDRLHISPLSLKSMVVAYEPVRIGPADGTMGDGVLSQAADADQLQGAVMRQTKSGDRIRGLGMSGYQSIYKYLSARKVDQPLRALWPVLAKDSEVLWVPGLGISQQAALGMDTQHPVILHFSGKLPDQI